MSLIRTAITGAVVAAVVQIILMLAMVGGPAEMYEVLEPMFQAELPWPPPHDDGADGGNNGGRSLDGRTVLVTGANRGYGLAIAQHMSDLGANRVLMACRSRDACARAAASVRGGVPVHVDLGRTQSVVACAAALEAAGERVDVLVLNAAVVDVGNVAAEGSGGVARSFLVNYLSNVALVRELLARGVLAGGGGGEGEAQQARRRARVVVISSGCYKNGWSNLDDDGGRGIGAFDDWSTLSAMQYYGQTKFLLQVWASWLAHAGAGPGGVDVVVHSPGPIKTALGSENVPWPLVPSYRLMLAMLFPTPAEASRPVAHLAARPRAFPSGTFLHIREVREVRADARGAGAAGGGDTEAARVEAWAWAGTRDALAAAGYDFSLAQLQAPWG